ncbi:MAG: helix-turn-helix domain-containing protein [Verrucomicrobiales bacterium]|nr:helix-turn-helix domain-containing protein [Verrucomicrobiales bacterium]
MASLGHRLREARLQHGLTEEQVSNETRISLANIRSLETDDYGNFNSPIYAKSFVKTYGSFLNLNVSDILAKFDEYASDSESIFRSNRIRPLVLAPVLVGIFGFLCFCLFSLFTGGSLPFAPGQATASEPTKKAAARITTNPVEDVEEETLIPVNVSNENDAPPEGGAYVDDFHASKSTVFLPMGGGSPAAVAP